MDSFIRELQTCLESTDLRAKHDALTRMIEGFLLVLVEEVGEVGGGGRREILHAQDALRTDDPACSEPFLQHSSDNDCALELTIGEAIAFDGSPYSISLMAFPGREWDFFGWSNGLDAVRCEVLELSRDGVTMAAKRLSCALVILSKVYTNHNGTLCATVRNLEESGLLTEVYS